MSVDPDVVARLRLIRTPSVGPVTYYQLLRRYVSAAQALEAVPTLARRGGGPAPKISSEREILAEIDLVDRLGAHYLLLGRSDYPALLAELDTAPPALIVKGRTELLDRPAVALVGARNASAAAVRFARGLAHDLSRAGQVVVSGLARGIDTAAHAGALEGGTIAVIAGGIDTVYPPENAAFQAEIAERGLLVAEQPPGVEPRARHFPSRNRIIAGLARGTIVIEAALQSGSLITARLAAEAGREVMAVPGSPLDPRAQGCNQLIRDGAILVQNAAEVIASLDPFGRGGVAAAPRSFRAGPVEEPDARDRALVDRLLSPTAVAVDELIRQSGLAPGTVQTILLELELAGRLERHAGGRVSQA